TLVSGTGSADNASFTIDGGLLKAAASFDFEAKSSHAIRVRSTDAGGAFTEKAFTITVTNVNEAPTDIILSASTIPENNAVGAVIGTLSTTDPDTLVSGTGSADNASFTIDGGLLKAAASFDFEAKNSYSIRVRATDAGGLSTEKVFTITVTSVNEAPTDIALSATAIAENNAIGAVVGTLTTTDPDAGDSFTYALVSGTGSDDNASFTIAGGQLKAAESFNFEAKNSYSIRVRATDTGGLFTEKAFTITVTNVVEGGATFAEATSLPLDGAGAATVTGTLAANGYAVYRVEAPRGAFLVASAPNSGSGDFSAVVRIWNAAGQEVRGPARTLASTYVAAGTGTATYFIGVSADPNISYDPQTGTTPPGIDAPAGGYSLFIFTKVAENVAPTGLFPWNTRFVDGMAAGTFVSGFNADDPNLYDGDTLTFALVAGEGDGDNARFAIVQSSYLTTASVFSVNADTGYSIRVRATDAGGLSFEQPLVITVTKNVPPTDLAMSRTRFVDGMPVGTTVATISAVDDNQSAGDAFAFALVTGQGDADNAKFAIDAFGALTATQVFSVTADTNYSIRVQVTDGAGHVFTKPLNITIEKNVAPTSISLYGDRILEGLPGGTTVGWLGVSDANGGNGDTVSYSLVAGQGDADNAKFSIGNSDFPFSIGNSDYLRTAEAFSVDADTAYSVRVRATDGAGNSFEQTFTITVRNNVPPTEMSLSYNHILEGMPVGTFIGTPSVTDANAREGDTFTYSLAAGQDDDDNALFQFLNASGGDWSASANDWPYGGLRTWLATAQPISVAADASLSIRARVTDRAGNTYEKAFSIAVENNVPPTDIQLFASPVIAGVPVGTYVGWLDAAD
ncbi:MAG: cadherin repeat domain-containing protein, partial [Planctomycetia bacterium]|nr:cadherin repeat domain-containing protein [Planctomycetia bacterium]